MKSNNKFFCPLKKIFLIILPTLLIPILVFAQMSSTNYQIKSDSINFGGNQSASSSYGLSDTLGESATGRQSSANYQLEAGFQQFNRFGISISDVVSVDLGSISGIAEASVSADGTWVVTTNDPDGYELSIRTTTNPALQSVSDEFTDYQPATADPDFNFTLAAGETEFGMSPSGTDIVNRFKDDGVSTCNTGSADTASSCWDGISTIDQIISRRTTSAPSGATTTVTFQAGLGPNSLVEPGNYQATVILTAVNL
jgi:hypothetical protein